MPTTETAIHTVTRGAGTKVHQAVTYIDAKGETRFAGTVCALDTNALSSQDLTLRTIDHPVTCRTCLGDQAAPVEHTDALAPACCPMHPQTSHVTVKTIKAGTKSEYPCGAIYWHGKGWDPRRNHAGA